MSTTANLAWWKPAFSGSHAILCVCVVKISPLRSMFALSSNWERRTCLEILSFIPCFFFAAYNGNGTETYRYLCNHRRAYKFFTDSISPKCYFTAFPCESYDKFEQGECFSCANGKECGRLGYYSNQAKGRGSLYLLTRDEEPFCGTWNIIWFIMIFFQSLMCHRHSVYCQCDLLWKKGTFTTFANLW